MLAILVRLWPINRIYLPSFPKLTMWPLIRFKISSNKWRKSSLSSSKNLKRESSMKPLLPMKILKATYSSIWIQLLFQAYLLHSSLLSCFWLLWIACSKSKPMKSSLETTFGLEKNHDLLSISIFFTSLSYIIYIEELIKITQFIPTLQEWYILFSFSVFFSMILTLISTNSNS